MPMLILAAVLAGLAATAPAARAATLTGSGGALSYRAAAGEANAFRMYVESGEVTVTDGVPLTARGSCRLVAARKARCGALATSATIRLGDGDDSALMQTSPLGGATVFGEAGDDQLVAAVQGPEPSRVGYVGGIGFDTMDYVGADRGVRIDQNDVNDDGRPGDRDGVSSDIERLNGSPFGDTIRGADHGNMIDGRTGGDVILAGAGMDFILQDPAADGGDFISGGGGRDFLDYSRRRNPVTVTFENDTRIANDGEAGEGDNVMSDIESVTGGRGDDTLLGDARDNELAGGPGNDRIAGGGGDDALAAGPGRDTVGGNGGDDDIHLADGEADIADCGAGRDLVRVDFGGADFATGCERRVEQTATTVGTLSLSPRTLTVRPGRTTIWRLAWTHPLRWSALDRVELVLEHAGRRVARVQLDQQTGRLRVSGRGVRLIERRSAASAAGPTARTVRLRLALRVSRRYAGRTLTARVAAVDDGGTREQAPRAGRLRVSPR